LQLSNDPKIIIFGSKLSRRTYRQEGGRIHNGAGVSATGHVSTGGRHIDSKAGVSSTGQVYQQRGGCINNRTGLSTGGGHIDNRAGVSTARRVYRPQAGHINNGAGVSATGRAYQQRGGCIDTRWAYRQQGRRINRRIDSTAGRAPHLWAKMTRGGVSPNMPPLVSLKKAYHSEAVCTPRR
jgi:hypothetical protein